MLQQNIYNNQEMANAVRDLNRITAKSVFHIALCVIGLIIVISTAYALFA